MATLQALFAEMGFDEVATFIASGNIIFNSTATDRSRLEASIERALGESLGYSVTTFLRTTDELAAVAARDPFGKPVPPGGRLFVGFLRQAQPPAARRKVAALGTATDAFRVHGRELYWLCASPSMQSIASGATLEKTLGGPATLRNINTVRRLVARYPPAARG
jgi:uncharacterized protein (DUF1697 family)